MSIDVRDPLPAGDQRSGVDVVVRVPNDADSIQGMRRRERLERAGRWVLPVLFFLVWQLAANFEVINTRFFPSPVQIWTRGIELIQSGRLQEASLVTIQRMLWGFAGGALIGFAVGVALGTMRSVRKAMEPMVYALWSVPKLAVLPLLLLIFGFGSLPIVSLVVLNTLFLVLLPTMSAMAGVSPDYTEAARSFEVSRVQMFWHVRLPAALPEVIVGLKISAGASILVVVAAEFVTGGSGLGHLIWTSWQVLLPEPMYVGIVTAAVIGSGFTMLISFIGRRIAPWAGDRF